MYKFTAVEQDLNRRLFTLEVQRIQALAGDELNLAYRQFLVQTGQRDRLDQPLGHPDIMKLEMIRAAHLLFCGAVIKT
jgi:hypothetical protein